MTKTWEKARASVVASAHLGQQGVTGRQARVQASPLAQLRNMAGLSQDELARRLGLPPSRVARIEQGDLEHTEMATLRAYTRALGGELEISVKLGDERLVLG